MSDTNLARRVSVGIVFDGADITEDIKPYLLGMTYSDSEDNEADDLTLELQDREQLWAQSWLEEAIQKTSASKLKIVAYINRLNWTSNGSDMTLPCGEFELDTVEMTGGSDGSKVNLSATSMPYSEQLRQTKKSREWENYYLSGIASEMASNAGMSCLYESSEDPYYERTEQDRVSDIDFLEDLCADAGISLKITAGQVVLFDQATYEAQDPAFTITRGDGTYSGYSLTTGAADTQYQICRVSYTDPDTGSCIEGYAYATDYDEEDENNQQLEITQKVSSVSEAEELAKKNLRLHNKFKRTATFTMTGNLLAVASNTFEISGFGGFDGKYIISRADHSVDNAGGHEVEVTGRRVLTY